MSRYYKLTIPSAGEEEQENRIAWIHYLSDFESVEQKEDTLIFSYSSDKQSETKLREVLDNLNPQLDYQIEKEEEINWNEEYEKSFQPIVLDDHSWGIRASFHPPLDTKDEIIIDPKMSFGTGHHETTYQMMEGMSKEDFENKTVWDYGSGTGILAILAEKKGATKVIANDHEEWAYHNMLENLETNQCERIQVLLGDTSVLDSIQMEFDFILANITKNILRDSALIINQHSKKGTILFLSGFYEHDITDIEKWYSNLGFERSHTSLRNQWACLRFVKTN